MYQPQPIRVVLRVIISGSSGASAHSIARLAEPAHTCTARLALPGLVSTACICTTGNGAAAVGCLAGEGGVALRVNTHQDLS